MKRADEQLGNIFRNQAFSKRYEQLYQETLNHPDIRAFLVEHDLDHTDAIVSRSMSRLYEYVNSSHQCTECPSLETCKNVMQGYTPKLILKNEMIDLHYEPCPTYVEVRRQEQTEKMLSSLHMPKDVLSAQLQHIDMFFDDSRVEVVQAAHQFLRYVKETGELPKKGMYIYGPFGVGKSFILGAIANELATQHIQTAIVYVPEFLREIKQSIQSQTFEQKIDYVKRVPVLMLDDIGAESMTAWTRDDVLGAILQYRMAEQLPTFFSSNFDLDELEHHMTYSQRGEKEEVKAARLMERVRAVSEPFALGGENRRKES